MNNHNGLISNIEPTFHGPNMVIVDEMICHKPTKKKNISVFHRLFCGGFSSSEVSRHGGNSTRWYPQIHRIFQAMGTFWIP